MRKIQKCHAPAFPLLKMVDAYMLQFQRQTCFGNFTQDLNCRANDLVNLEASDSSLTESSGCSHRNILWQDTSKPQPSTGEPQEIGEYVSCCL